MRREEGRKGEERRRSEETQVVREEPPTTKQPPQPRKREVREKDKELVQKVKELQKRKAELQKQRHSSKVGKKHSCLKVHVTSLNLIVQWFCFLPINTCNLYMCTSVATKYDILAQLSFHQFPLYEKCIALSSPYL